MARVPTYDNFQVGVEGGRMPATEIRDIGAEQMQRAGQQFLQAGERFTQIEVDRMELANQVRVDDAINRIKEESLRLQFDKDVGFTSQKGLTALERKSGKALADEYGESLQSTISGISSELGNDAQRRMFTMAANDVVTKFRGAAQKHESDEFRTYALSVREGTIGNRLREIGLNYNRPDIIDQAVLSIKAATNDIAKLTGKSAEWVEYQTRKMTSNAHVVALTAALDKNDVGYAEKYMAKYRDQMDADDLLKVSAHVTKQAEANYAFQTARKHVASAAVTASGSDMDRIINITMQSESGGRRYGKDGKLLESPKGAKGEMQVLDSTNTDPGFGVAPAKDNSPEERARVGRDYMAALVKRYNGDVAKAWAAYNAGPGRLEAAVKAAEKEGTDWRAKMPAETQAYVAKNEKAFLAGGGAQRRPSLMELTAKADAELGPNARPSLRKTVHDEVKRQHEELEKAIEDRKKSLVEDAERAIMANGGNYDALPVEMRMRISQYAPDKVPALIDYGKKLSNPETDWETYTQLRALAANDPDRFAKEDLRRHYPRLGAKDRETLIDLQMKARDPEKKHQVQTLSQQLTTAHGMLGFKSGDVKKKAKFDNAVTMALAAAEKDKGKPLSFDERDKIIKRMMLPTDKGWFGTTRVYEVFGTADEPTAKPKITTDEDRLIRMALLSEGIEPTEKAIQARFKLRYGLK